MNLTHTWYRTLSTTNQALLAQLRAIAQSSSSEEAQERFQPYVASEQEADLDYLRLYALLRKDLRGVDLQNEDFQQMPLDGFQFCGANLRGANFQGATLTKANLQTCDLRMADFTGANCDEADLRACQAQDAHFDKATLRRVHAQQIGGTNATLTGSDWTDADLRNAHLVGVKASHACFMRTILHAADLSFSELYGACFERAFCQQGKFQWSDLRTATFEHAMLESAFLACAKLEGANFRESICLHTNFGDSWNVDAQTQIDLNNHVLIGFALLNNAKTAAQKQFALYVQFERQMCWPGFIKLLLRQSPALLDWAAQTLNAFESLRPGVETGKTTLERLRSDRRQSLDVSQINPNIHMLLLTELEQQTTLSALELYWYLRGVVIAASQRPELHMDDAQKHAVLEHLKCLRRGDPLFVLEAPPEDLQEAFEDERGDGDAI